MGAPDEHVQSIPLYRQLQRFLQQQGHLSDSEAKRLAVEFMRNYWLGGDNDKLLADTPPSPAPTKLQ